MINQEQYGIEVPYYLYDDEETAYLEYRIKDAKMKLLEKLLDKDLESEWWAVTLQVVPPTDLELEQARSNLMEGVPFAVPTYRLYLTLREIPENA